VLFHAFAPRFFPRAHVWKAGGKSKFATAAPREAGAYMTFIGPKAEDA
jgi:hypothetical protein